MNFDKNDNMTLAELLMKIDENQNKINSYGKFSDTVLKKINYKFRLDWNYYSNRMEGGTLTKQETRSVMVGNISIKDKPIRDVMEMNGHDKVVLDVLSIGKGEKRISEKRIKDVHKAIMYEEDAELRKEVGSWKTKPNEIINYKNEKIIFTPPSEVATRIHDILDLTNAELDSFFQGKKDKKHPLLIASSFHLDYVSTHPFYDGNGRTARIFTNLILISCGLPVIIIKDEHKKIYYQYLADIQVYGGSPELFHSFISERILESQQLILDALSGKEIDEPDDLDKRITLIKNILNSDDKVKERKNINSVYKVLSDIAFPLFLDVQKKCSELDELFFENSNEAQFSDHSSHIFRVKSKEYTWAMVKQNWLDTQFLSNKIDLRSFEFMYELKGFKKSVHAQSTNMRLIFWFDDYNYTILTQMETRENGIKKMYNDGLSVKEKNDIIKKTLDPILDQIERFVERK